MKENEIRKRYAEIQRTEGVVVPVEVVIALAREAGATIEAERVVLPPVEAFEFEADPSNYAIGGTNDRLTEEQAEVGAARLNAWELAREAVHTLLRQGGTKQARREMYDGLKEIFELEEWV